VVVLPLVEYNANFKIAIYGKKFCGHKASEKHALAGKKEAEVQKRRAYLIMSSFC
jgi:hypothetical protein